MRGDWSTVSDGALAMGLARYQQDALAEAYRRHAGPVFGLAKRLLGVQAQAEEVVQEVFLRLWNNPERYEPERGSLRSYLLAQTHGRSIDMMRSDASRRAREERDAHQTGQGTYDLDRELWDMAVAGEVRTALQALDPGEREAIELAYFGGMTYREVASHLGQAEGTVKSRIRVGLKRLRGTLTAAGLEVGAS
jgi:RNA polymerase sigma-70 factor (ECF subfamily)